MEEGEKGAGYGRRATGKKTKVKRTYTKLHRGTRRSTEDHRDRSLRYSVLLRENPVKLRVKNKNRLLLQPDA